MIVNWEENPDGEYGEVQATVNGHKITVYSDRDGQHWYYEIEIDGDGHVGPFSSREIAQREVIIDARQA